MQNEAEMLEVIRNQNSLIQKLAEQVRDINELITEARLYTVKRSMENELLIKAIIDQLESENSSADTIYQRYSEMAKTFNAEVFSE